MYWISSFDFYSLILSASWDLFICLAFLSLPVSGMVVCCDSCWVEGLHTTKHTPSRVPWSRGMLLLSSCILVEAWANSTKPRVPFISGIEPWDAEGVCHSSTRAGGQGRSWWPQVELIGCWLLSAVLLSAANQVLIHRWEGSLFLEHHLNVQCNSTLLWKRNYFPPSIYCPHPIPLLGVQLWFFWKKGCIWQPRFQRRPEILVMFMTKMCFYFFPFATIALKLKDFHCIFITV